MGIKQSGGNKQSGLHHGNSARRAGVTSAHGVATALVAASVLLVGGCASGDATPSPSPTASDTLPDLTGASSPSASVSVSSLTQVTGPATTGLKSAIALKLPVAVAGYTAAPSSATGGVSGMYQKNNDNTDQYGVIVAKGMLDIKDVASATLGKSAQQIGANWCGTLGDVKGALICLRQLDGGYLQVTGVAKTDAELVSSFTDQLYNEATVG